MVGKRKVTRSSQIHSRGSSACGWQTKSNTASAVKSIPSGSSILSHSSRIKCRTFFNARSLSLASALIDGAAAGAPALQHYIKLSKLEKNHELNDLLDALGLLDPLDFNQVVIFVKSMSRAAEVH
ncbi:hypothetical protein AAC387_Pa02g2757 [Persea americana]